MPRRFHGQGLLQHCRDKGDDYHLATAYYLTNLFTNKARLAQTALHLGINDQLRLTAEENFGRHFQDIDSQESNHLNQVNERLLYNAGDNVGKGTFTLSGQEIPGQCANKNDGFSLADKATIQMVIQVKIPNIQLMLKIQLLTSLMVFSIMWKSIQQLLRDMMPMVTQVKNLLL